MGTMIFR